MAAFALALGLNPLSNNDLWLHLTTGRLIVERAEIPRVDEYSYTRAGQPYVAHEWLAQVLLHGLNSTAGSTGLILLKPLALLGAGLLVMSSCLRLGASRGAGLLGAAAAMLVMSSHLYVRPHLASFVLLAAAARLLLEVRQGSRRALLALLAIQVLWANLHGGFVLGVALAAASGAWKAAGLMGAASFLNPYGPALYRFVLIFSEPAFRRHIKEWSGPFQPPFVGSFHFSVYLILMAAAVAALIAMVRRRRAGAVASLALFLLLSLISKRNVSLLGIVAVPWIALASVRGLDALAARIPAAGRRAVRLRQSLAPAGVLLASAAAAWLGVPHESGAPRRPGFGVEGNVPRLAMDFIASRGIAGRAMASFGFGSYVVFRAWPSSTVFIDSRLDVYGGPFIERQVAAMRDPDRFRELLAEAPADYALLSYQLEDVEGAVLALEQDPGWALVYFDDVAILYLRRLPRWERLITELAYESVNPYLFLTGRANPARQPEPALAELRRARAIAPSCLVARLMTATALQAVGRHREALAVLSQAGLELPGEARGRALLYGMIGTSHLELGELEEARRAFERLESEAPGSTYADRMLEEVSRRQGNR